MSQKIALLKNDLRIGFTDVSGDRTAEALSEYVFKCIETWKCKNKLIAQTYDGCCYDGRRIEWIAGKG